MKVRVLLIFFIAAYILSGCSLTYSSKAIKRSIASENNITCLESVTSIVIPKNVENYHLLKNDQAKISEKYTNNSRFTELSSDAAHSYKQTFKSMLEAVTGLYAEKKGILQYPIIRGPPESEFIDGNNIMWDVKTPISPLPWQKWKFNVEAAGNSVRKKLLKVSGIHILLDISYLRTEHLTDLRNWINLNLTKEMLSKIKEIYVPDGIETLQK